MRTLTLVAMLLLSTTARATMLQTGLGFAVETVDCAVVNVSKKPVEVDPVSVIDDNGNSLTVSGRRVTVTKETAKSVRGSLLLFANVSADDEVVLEAR